MPLHATLGVQRHVGAHFGRSTPIYWPFLALNARTMLVLGVQRQDAPILGVQRQNYALFWRLNARQMLLQGVIFLLLFLIPFSIFLFIL